MVEHPNHLPNQQNNMPDGDDDEMDVEEGLEIEEIDDYENDTSFPESEELESIDNQLDELNSALDDIEQKNDNILAELTELLNENREIRKQLQQVRIQNDMDTTENEGDKK